MRAKKKRKKLLEERLAKEKSKEPSSKNKHSLDVDDKSKGSDEKLDKLLDRIKSETDEDTNFSVMDEESRAESELKVSRMKMNLKLYKWQY